MSAASDVSSPAAPRRTARIAGAPYLLNFVSIPTLVLQDGLRDPNYVLGPGSGTGAGRARTSASDADGHADQPLPVIRTCTPGTCGGRYRESAAVSELR